MVRAEHEPASRPAASNTVRFPDQRSLTDQLRDLRHIANREGMYDAADYLAMVIVDVDARVAGRP